MYSVSDATLSIKAAHCFVGWTEQEIDHVALLLNHCWKNRFQDKRIVHDFVDMVASHLTQEVQLCSELAFEHKLDNLTKYLKPAV